MYVLALIIFDCVVLGICLNSDLIYVGNSIEQDELKLHLHAK